MDRKRTKGTSPWPCVVRVDTHTVKAYSFDMSVPKMVLSPSDAQKVLELGEDDDDVLNEVRNKVMPHHIKF